MEWVGSEDGQYISSRPGRFAIWTPPISVPLRRTTLIDYMSAPEKGVQPTRYLCLSVPDAMTLAEKLAKE